MTKGYLVLSDGTVYEGRAWGALEAEPGEVVFNTSMTGYQEILTDPSYFGQIVVMTYPLIGNYGIFKGDNQSRKPYVKGFVVRELYDDEDHWRSEDNLEAFLKEEGIIALDGIDTRSLTKKIRDVGVMAGQIIINEADIESTVNKLKSFELLGAVMEVTTEQSYTLEPEKWNGKHVAVMDFGIKRNILNSMLYRGIKLTVFPADATAEDIMAINPDGIFLSNGPGDPKELTGTIETIKNLMYKKPIFGICLGHQLLCLAYGGDTVKLKYGHRGGNHPVKDLVRNKVVITSQNHGYVVLKESLDEEKIEITHLNVNDKTLEGVRHKQLPIFSVQYHPEASPGPKDSEYLFDVFASMMDHDC
jgi:carbamoyl-phosphate synthase small subunit